jgi:hypothetical protein
MFHCGLRNVNVLSGYKYVVLVIYEKGENAKKGSKEKDESKNGK